MISSDIGLISTEKILNKIKEKNLINNYLTKNLF